MTHIYTLRPAMTALAAVIALSATPLLAQSADEPVVTTSPIVDETPAPVVADPVATAPVADTAADPLAAEAAPASPARTAAKAKPAAAKARPATPPAARATVAAAPAASSVDPALAADAAVEPLPIEPPAAVVAPVEPAAASDAGMNEMLPVAAAGGLALVLLAGTALAIRRRRRRAQEAEDTVWQDDVETAADPVPEPAMIEEPAPMMVAEPAPALTRPALQPTQPAFVAAATPDSEDVGGLTPIDGPTTDLPEDFDLSRFGFNVQQAYQGPTEDNPSLSLKHRLRRASGMDQQERNLDEEVEAATGESPLAEADEPMPAAEAPADKPATGDFLLPRDDKQPTVRPTYTR